MQDKSFVPFTEEMIKDYTILVPNMLPMHFKLIASVMKNYGYNFELLQNDGPEIAETGLKYTHNDTCYPAILVVGQFMDALLSGKYDPHKTALIMFQTGGGCRASNYISLIRKALKKADMEYIPVISFNLAGLEKHPGFKLNLKKLQQMIYAVLYGDLLMNLVNQVRPFEIQKGNAEHLADVWVEKLGEELGSSRSIRYKSIRQNYRKIVESFKEIPTEKRDAVKVGVVGEIFVKYSPLGNNNLERFIIREGGQPVVPGLLDFCLYCVYDKLAESGCKNIVCTQPFGCLPNHICGKGMMKPIKELCPDVNIVAIDYDAGASRVNQENRLKLMLANAKKKISQSKEIVSIKHQKIAVAK